MFKKLVRRVLGDPNKKVIDSLEPMVVAVTEAEERFHELSDEELRNETVKLRERVQAGETIGYVGASGRVIRRPSIRRRTSSTTCSSPRIATICRRSAGSR